MEKIYVIIPAAGKGERAKQVINKVFSKIDNEEIILKTTKKFEEIAEINKIIIPYSEGELDTLKDILKDVKKEISFVKGGKSRFSSVKNALNTITDGIVLIHDGARPLISKKAIINVINSVKKYGSGVLVSPCVNTIVDTDGKGNILSSLRKNKYQAETPQGFLVKDIKKAYGFANEENEFTDDAGVYCSYIGTPKIVINEDINTKITYPEDILSLQSNYIRCGTGFDLHRLVEGRELIIGGINIPHSKGLLGHSDADVLIHAIMDALLTSVSLRDIGYYFPDTDDKYKGISSIVLLGKVIQMVKAKGYEPLNVTAVIMAEKPKMSPYVELIKKNLSHCLNVPEENIGISLTTLEGIGVVGREEGIAVSANVLVKRII